MSLNNTDAKDVVNEFLNLLVKKNPALKKEVFAIRTNEKLMNTMSEMVLKMKPGISAKDLANKETLKQLSVMLVSTITMNKLSMDKNKNFMEKIKSIFDKKDPKLLQDPEFLKKLLDPKQRDAALDKLFTPEEKKGIQKELERMMAEFFHDLKTFGLMTPKLVPPGKSDEKKAEEEAAINLFGVISLYVTGGIQPVVTSFTGNLLGIVDVNSVSSEESEANIDRFKRPVDSQISGELRESTETNYMQFSGSNFIEELKTALGQKNLAVEASTTPTLKMPGITPPK